MEEAESGRLTWGHCVGGTDRVRTVAGEARYEIPKLELLSEQTLFNMGINQVGLEGMDPSLLKVLGPKILRKRKVETTDGKSAHARIEPLPTPLTFETEESEPQAIDNFQIVWVHCNSSSLVLEEGQRSPIEYLFSEAILSLPAPDVSDLFPNEESIEAARTFEMAPARVQLRASILEDYGLACKVFSNFLYPADAAKLLIEPLKTKRQKALDYFIRLAHYLNGFMECSIDLSAKASKHKMDVEMLKIARDRALREVDETSARADDAERRAQDAEAALRKSIEENFWLSGIKEALTTEVEVLKTQSAKAKALTTKTKIMLKSVEEKKAKLQSEVEA
ncbi:hypothetical protein COCNU_15G004100 [Cocos nucifera]|uniref:Uncharacterized protein n=1 Tax=Cocos nucifera TaxID=13894 RepID=A0A8K0NCW1_COCNU|nr:hypothetical protein COCNU_15G004100 [Cocos nucifera]